VTTCTVSFSANPGPNTFVFTLTDSSNNVLSSFSTLNIIQPSTLNTLSFTSNPVVSSVSLQLASASENAGTPVNDLLTVNAKDADGNTIVGNAPYVDSNGNSLAFSLDVSNTQAGGKGTVTIQGPSLIHAPNHAAIYAHYDGNWLASSTISLTAVGGTVASVTGTTLTSTPYATEYSSGISSGAVPYGIANGPDGNLWSVEYSGNAILKTTTAGTNTEFSSGMSASATPIYIVQGADGAMWFSEKTANRIGRITTSGIITEYTGMSGTGPIGITKGVDGNIWFVEVFSNYITSLSASGIFSHFTVNQSSPRGIMLGPDGNLWVTYQSAACISRITSAGVETDFCYSGSLGGHPDEPVTGPDGNIWFPSADSSSICQLAINTGTITTFSTGISSNAGIRTLTDGPDGNIWFNESNYARIGRITTSGTVTEFDASNGFNTNSRLNGLTQGSDGNIWFADGNLNAIGKFVL